ncbi:GNAT family N-acetyltransferase [Microlunatus soli]|uniref:GNAT family N-acetyltransferase n=1 Tax=Microlunatus soli TaxID=630515 RepID=UPI001E331E0A|nr:GNAT family N-acetyltransferase [Microlunatus soli]
MRREPLNDGLLILEPLTVEHAEEMVEVLADPQLYAFTGGSAPTLAELRHRYARQVAGHSSDRTQWWLNWVIRLRLDPDRPAVGYLQATVAAEPLAAEPLAADRATAELAWVVGMPWQGRGIAARAAGLVADQLRPTRLIAHIHPDHRASEAIAHRLGMAPTDEVVDGERRWSTG